MRREVNRADIGGKSGNKVKDCHVTIIRSLLSQIKENSLRVLLTYRKLFTINTKIAVEFIIKNLNDLNKFTGYFEKIDAKPLPALTNGVHLHTISADSEENMELIKSELSEKGFIL